MKELSWGPGWGWLCGCATCISCCCGCPRLVILTVLSSCWKDSKFCGDSGRGSCWGMRIASRLRPRRSRLMPVRCCLVCRWLAGSGRTVCASKAAGVEFCRRCCVRRFWMLEVALMDSIVDAGTNSESRYPRMWGLSCVVRNSTQCKRRPPGGWDPYGLSQYRCSLAGPALSSAIWAEAELLSW
jgi:hypothetical protein